MFDIEVDDRKIIAKFADLPPALRAALMRKVTALRLRLEAKVKQKLSGDILNVRSGNLRRSIFSETVESGTTIAGRVASSGDVKYAAIHEFGGKTAAHEILASKAKALHFLIGGKEVFAKKVNHPGSVMPERSFMRSSLKDMREQIVDELTSTVNETLKGD